MKNIIHNLYLPVVCCLISYSSVNGQKTYNDSIIHADSTAAIVTSIDQRFSKGKV